MHYSLPEIHEISIKVDGRRFDGSWYIILDQMIVNYNGRTTATPEQKTNADDVAVAMLRELVKKHYVPLESIPPDIPEAIRLAAHEYVNTNDEESAAKDLVAAFAASRLSSIVHKQLSWLCVNGISMIVPVWKHMCDGNAAEETFHDLRNWLRDPKHKVNWETATTPAVGRRDGVRVGDCDACRLEPTADAVASTARYLQSADPADATAALLAAGYAYDEGCHAVDAPDRFEKWLVLEVLQPSLDCTSI